MIKRGLGDGIASRSQQNQTSRESSHKHCIKRLCIHRCFWYQVLIVSATSNHSTAPHSAYSDAEIIEQLKQKLQYAELKIRVLEERLRLQRIA